MDEWRLVRKVRGKYVRGLLDLLILSSLRKKEMSGYEVIGRVHKTVGTLLSPGTVYPVLNSMEQMGLMKGTMSGRKRLYCLTVKGESVYESLALEFSKIVKNILLLQTTTEGVTLNRIQARGYSSYSS